MAHSRSLESDKFDKDSKKSDEESGSLALLKTLDSAIGEGRAAIYDPRLVDK